MKDLNMGLKPTITCIILLIFSSACSQKETKFVWPNGAKAAICLTYDDGLPSHVNTVVPMLNKYNFKGTFYPTLASSSLYDQMSQWKALAKDGHELGNHTVYHPCRKSGEGMEWVKDYLDLDNYTTDQIVSEIELANSFLMALDDGKNRTFAYPCAHFRAGGNSYKDSLYIRFSAARDSNEEKKLPIKLDSIDIYSVQSWAPNQHKAEDLIDYIDQIIAAQTLSTITFHGVGAEHMRVSKNAHEEMLKYLDANRDKIWVATFQAATDYLKSNRIEK